MKTIRLETRINAPVERCFKLALSVDLHAAPMHSTRDRPTRSMLGVGDTITWFSRHFGLRFRYTTLIDRCRPHMYFRDVMVKGMLQSFEHEHHFAVMNDGTRMRDQLRFSASGPLAWAIEPVLRRHLIKLLKRRNVIIKQAAQSAAWHRYLEGSPARKSPHPAATERDLRQDSRLQPDEAEKLRLA